MGSRIDNLGKEKYAYIAGFLDGDGCIAINYEKSKTCSLGIRVRVRISFTQHKLKKNVLDKLLQWIKSGKIADYQHNNMSEYVIRDQRIVENLLKAIQPYLIVKRKHAVIALEVIKLKKIKEYTILSLRAMRNKAIQMRKLNNYPKKIYLDPVTTEA